MVVCRKICYILLVVILIISTPVVIYGKEITANEVKASWIYTIIDWIDWKTRPKNKETIICTIGRDKVYVFLKKIKREIDGEKNHTSFSVKNKDPNDNFGECYILYISDSEQEYYMEIVEKANDYKGIITVSSISGFARRGGAIEFVIRKKARSIINLKIANNAKVAIDDEFYGWAETIH